VRISSSIRMRLRGLRLPFRPRGALLARRFSAMPRIPLDQPFSPEFAVTVHRDLPATAEQRVTTLSNGVRVASVANPVPVAGVGVFVNGGQRHEPFAAPGIAHMLELMAFKSTKSRSDFKLVRDMTAIGGNLLCSGSREHILYAADVLKAHVPFALDTLTDVVANHAFAEEEVEDAKQQYLQDIEDKAKEVEWMMTEAIHIAAWRGNTLGLPQYCTPEQLSNLTPSVLRTFLQRAATPSRTVAIGVGIDNHDEFVKQCEKFFARLPAEDPSFVTRPARYTGGEVRLEVPYDPEMDLLNPEYNFAHFYIAFESEGWNSEDAIPLCVLQSWQGGGKSFSSGGPGKGMYTRLYRQYLNKYGWLESAQCFTHMYADSAILGISSSCQSPQDLPALVQVTLNACKEMAGPIKPEELNRAKAMLKSSIWMNLEQRTVQLEDLGRQLFYFGRPIPAAELCEKIDRVTEEDVRRVALKALQSTPAVAFWGQLQYAPAYQPIVTYLRGELGRMLR